MTPSDSRNTSEAGAGGAHERAAAEGAGRSAQRPAGALLNPRTLPGDLRRAKAGTLLGLPLRYLDETTSTNDQAMEWAGIGASEGSMVIAAAQTSGRGRQGRHWLSAPGSGLWFSLVLRPGLAYPASGMLPLAAGFGVVAALRRLGLPAALKWPNDALVRGRKAAGVLVEGKTEDGLLATAIVGIGVNWRIPDDPEIASRATGLEAEFAALAAPADAATAGRPPDATPAVPPPDATPAGDAPGGAIPGRPDPASVLAAILDGVERAYLLLKAAGPNPFIAAWPRFSAHFGRLASVSYLEAQTTEEVLTGAIHPDGTLEVVTPGGGKKRIASGEVGLWLGTNPQT